MYEPYSGFYTQVVQNQTRRIRWSGTIKADGTTYNFGSEHIVAKSGKITNEISGSTMELGTVYSSELDIGIYIDDIGVPRDKIYGAVIKIDCTLTANNVTRTCPMGVFTVVEAKQSGNVCSIVAYDGMSAFDIDFPMLSGANKPYDWAESFCEACGVTLGTTETEFKSFPNGNVILMLTWEDGIETYRNALSMLAAAVGCSAHFDRDGNLVFYPLKSQTSVATIKANDRYKSGIAQTSWTPSSIYVTNKETGDVYSRGNGNIVFDLKYNVFLQAPGQNRDIEWHITGPASINDMLANILTSAHSVTAVPTDADIPLDPCLDLFDIVTLTGGQADNTPVLITSLIHNIGGGTELKCAGANTTEEARGSSGNSGSNTNDCWIASALSEEVVIGTTLMTWGDAASDTWDDLSSYTWGELTSGGNEILVCKIELIPPKEMNGGFVSFSVNYEADADMTVMYCLYVDGNLVWDVYEDQKAGKIMKTITTPIRIWSREDRTYEIIATMAGVDV